MNHSKKLVVLCLTAIAALGCGSTDEEVTAQTEQEQLRDVPKSIEKARAEALRSAAEELREALREIRHERQSHDAQSEVYDEIERLEAEARYWEARVPRHSGHGH